MNRGNLSVEDTLNLLKTIERTSLAKKTLEKRLSEQKHLRVLLAKLQVNLVAKNSITTIVFVGGM